MSKFFEATQKAQQFATPAQESRRVDVVSVIDAIKLSEAADTEALVLRVGETETGTPEVAKPTRGPIATQVGPSPLPPSASEAYRSLRTRVMKLQGARGVRSLMLTSSLPAEGKTLTSLNLSVSCAKLHDMRVLLVDADLRSRGLTRLLKISDGPGLSDVLAGKSNAENAILPTDDEDLFVLGAGSENVQPSELFANALWPQFVASASQAYGMVIIDAPPIHSISDAELISAGCDGILIVVRALVTPRELAQKCIGRLDKRKLMGIVFNGTPSGAENDYGYYGTAG
jgi:capsular exopolysaccharide synthesis family protein